MHTLLFVLGIGCLSWTLAELLTLARGSGRGPARARFGAVDLETQRDLDVVFDRRAADRGRRCSDPIDCSLWA